MNCIMMLRGTVPMHVLILLLLRGALAVNDCDRCDCCKNGKARCHYFNSISDYCLDGCIDGYYGSRCTSACPSQCLNCSYHRDCNSCKNGYHNDNIYNDCRLRCRTNCKACTQYDYCTECEGGYYGTGADVCGNTCPESCKSCTSYDNCNECVDGTFNGNFKNCSESCINNCISCTFNNCTACTLGKYGDSCQSDCGRGCKFRTCDMTTGSCTCESNFYGDKCDQCSPGYYGASCNVSCSVGCLNNSCFVDGSCDCKTGFNGRVCDQCFDGRYGLNCNVPCPDNCADGICTRAGNCISCIDGFYGTFCDITCPDDCASNMCTRDGNCSNCKPGLIGTKCDQCEDSKYGDTCEQICPPGCADNICSRTGECTEGCKMNFTGSSCENCVSGIYGNNCDESCIPNCKLCTSRTNCSTCYASYWGNTCEPCPEHCYGNVCGNTGQCFSCINGYYGTTCSSVYCSEYCSGGICNSKNGICVNGCEDGNWGGKCHKTCNPFCLRCKQYDGVCSVCKDGKYLADCSKDCKQNCNTTNATHICAITDGSCLNGCDTFIKYGKFCELTCSINCLNQTCNWRTGDCLNGCVRTNYGKRCEKTCNINCRTGKTGRSCNEETGQCILGCVNGFYGDFCDRRCNTNCINSTCNRDAGECLYGCVTRYTGTRCTLEQAGTVDNTGVAIAAAVGGCFFVLVVILVVIVVLLLKRRQRDTRSDKHNMVENSDNTINTAVQYSDLTFGQSDDRSDVDHVYAVPYEQRNNVREVNAPERDKKPSTADLPESQYVNTTIKSSILITPTTKHRPAMYFEKDLRSKAVVGDCKVVCKTEESQSSRTEEVADTYYNSTAVKRMKITLEQLTSLVSKTTTEDYVAEFQKLPAGLINPYTDSQRRENISKNRHKGIYPYDKTRVVLTEGDADYINASYIKGYDNRIAYIASTGPTSKYMGDMSAFWIMVWQEKVGKIVMLTNLSETGEPNCDQYWPEKDASLPYADIQVTCQREDIFADYTIRTFNIQKKSEGRNIVQVHFTAWPDKGTPEDETSFVEFHQKVNSLKLDVEGPTIVHCRDGIGRTGTYIALDILTAEGEAEGEVDIYGCVRDLRGQRVNMVQTVEQYQFLYKAIVHKLTFDSKPVEASQFSEYMETHTEEYFEKTFMTLCDSIEQNTNEETESVVRKQALKSKRRVGADISGDHLWPKLNLQTTPSLPCNVNTVYVDSYRIINRYLVAQSPLPNTVVDFLTLIVHENVSCIVNMENDSEPADDETIGAYFPQANKTLQEGAFQIKSERGVSTDQYQLRTLNISHKGKSGSEEVVIPYIQFTRWCDQTNLPEEPAMFVQFVKDVKLMNYGNQSRGPILVHCRDGTQKSGLFCVVSLLLEKIEMEQEVSVLNTVRHIKVKRNTAIPNKDQYIFCHQCVNAYLRSVGI